ncbi:MAG TPA: ABC transporter permease [Bryobacteraceae bacterium]|jgi:putative ABC transport system permease protein
MIARTLFRRANLAICLLFGAGVAVSTASFSIFNGVFLRAFPYPEPDRLVHIATPGRGATQKIRWKHLEAWREQSSAFEKMAAFREEGYYLTGAGEPMRVVVAAVSVDLDTVLGIKFAVGRPFLAEEDSKAAKAVAILSYRLWRERFGGSREIVGKTVILDRKPYEVVGVLPPNVVYPADADLWIPLQRIVVPNVPYLEGIGRLKHGVTINQAVADLDRIIATRPDGFDKNSNIHAVVDPMRTHDVEGFAPYLKIVNGAVAGLFLIVCLNAACLVALSGISRGREFGIRLALGAGRFRLIRMIAGETLTLGVAGGAVGVGLSYVFLKCLLILMPDILPPWVAITMDWPALAFAAMTVVVLSLSAALLPSFQFFRSERVVRPPGHRAMMGLVVIEIALAVVVVTATTLVMDAYFRLHSRELGIKADRTVTFALDPFTGGEAGSLRFYREYLQRMRDLPGVTAAGATFEPPMGVGRGVAMFNLAGDFHLGSDVPMHIVTRGYLAAAGTRLVAGRDFTPGEPKESLIVTESFARRIWPNGDPIGRPVNEYGGRPGAETLVGHIVVGVAADSRLRGPEEDVVPEVYAPHGWFPQSQMYVLIRGSSEPRKMIAEAARIARELDPGVTPFDFQTLEQRLDRLLWLRRTYSWLLFMFSAVSVVLITFGLYAVLAFSVAERRKELAIRVAIGASRGNIVMAVLRRGFAMAGIGAGAGIAGASLVNRLLAPVLAGSGTHMAEPYSLALLILGGAILVASLIPAWRAASVDPTDALRSY